MGSGAGTSPARHVCPHCGETFHLARADTSEYLLCDGCGLVRMLPFAALNPGSSLMNPLPRPTAL